MAWYVSRNFVQGIKSGKLQENLPYLQEPEGESWEDIYLDGAPAVQWNGMSMPEASFLDDKKKDCSLYFQSGMMYRRFREQPGKDILMSFLEAFPVQTFPVQEKEQDYQEPIQASGGKWQESLAKWNPLGSSWKTPQCSLFGDWTECLEALPRWGMMRNGELYLLQPLVLSINESESGFSPDDETFFHTPNCSGLDGGSNGRKALKKKRALKEQKPVPDGEVFFHTPNCSGNTGGSNSKKALLKRQAAKEMWPTPTSEDERGNLSIRKENQFFLLRRDPRLVADAQTWATPRSCSAMNAHLTTERLEKGTLGAFHNLEKQVAKAEQLPPEGAYLNPDWIEWLMG